MEPAQCELNTLHLRLTEIKLFFGKRGKRTLQIRLHSLRWLIGEFDTAFEDTNRDTGRRLRRQEQAKVVVYAIRLGIVRVECLFQFLAPLWHQVDIFEYDPMSFLRRHFQLFHGDHVLTLTHRHTMIFAAVDETRFQRNIVHGLHWICASRQNEENRSPFVAVVQRRTQHLMKRFARVQLSVQLTIGQGFRHKVLNSHRHAIRTHTTHNTQFGKRIRIVQFTPIQRKRILFRRLLQIPFFESIR
mmetsp:Transcript_45118/g.74799  ORF Transcript_45118/g.74799 Transcript_45118/m.74799 type:complete len:244 (+) Transcript_45118:1548-2279(+)